MRKFIVFFLLLILTSCSGQTKSKEKLSPLETHARILSVLPDDYYQLAAYSKINSKAFKKPAICEIDVEKIKQSTDYIYMVVYTTKNNKLKILLLNGEENLKILSATELD